MNQKIRNILETPEFNFENYFENEIIPLLHEYFYNDFGKIGLVLGKGFMREKSDNPIK
jgi:hypothetical protein